MKHQGAEVEAIVTMPWTKYILYILADISSDTPTKWFILSCVQESRSHRDDEEGRF